MARARRAAIGPLLERLPADVRVERGPRGGVLAVRPEHAAALAAAGFGPDGGERLEPSALGGRAALGEVPGTAGRLLVRRFRHGGLLRFATGARYADPRRPFRELLVADALGRAGVATPRVAAARARPAPLLGWRLDLVTERVAAARDGGEWLARLSAGGVPPAERLRVLAAAGETVGRMHRAGVRHPDLQPKNLLLAAGVDGLRVLVLDLDRAALAPDAPRRRRLADLRRLHRAVEHRARSGPLLTRADRLRFLRAWRRAAGDAAPEGGRDARWRADWRAVARSHALHRPVHALARGLERLAAGRRGRAGPSGEVPSAGGRGSRPS